MDFLTLAKNRYSCKNYDGRPLAAETLQGILEAGQAAPTAKNLQAYKVYVLQSQEALAKMDQVTPCRYNAATVLMVTFEAENAYVYPGGKRDSGVEDATIVATHLMLAAKAFGVESCWINRADPGEVKEAFHLPAQEDFLMFLDLGYPAEGAGPLPNHGNRKPLSETVVYL